MKIYNINKFSNNNLKYNLEMENIRNDRKMPVKQKLYDINYNLANSINLQLNISLALLIIKYIQLIGLTSTTKNPYLKNSLIQEFFQFFLLQSFRRSFIVPYLIFCTFINIILLFLFINNASSEIIKQILAKFMYIWNTIFILPNLLKFNEILVNLQQFQISIIIIILVGFSLQLLIYANFQYCYFNFSITTKDSFARNPNIPYNQLIIILGIFLLEVIQKLNKSFFVITTIINLVAATILLVRNCKQYKYHNQILNRCEGLLTTIYLIFNFCYTFNGFFQLSMIQDNFLLMVFIVQVFGILFYLNYRNNYFKTIIIEDTQSQKNQKSIDIFFRSYLKFFQTSSLKKSEFYISSLLKIHINSCNDIDCSCKSRQKLYDPKQCCFGSPEIQPHKDKVFFKHFLLEILVKYTKIFKNSLLLNLNLGFYYLEVLKIYTKPVEILRNLKKKKKKQQLSLPHEYLTFLFERQIRKLLIQKNDSLIIKRLMIQNIKQFDIRYNQISMNIIQSASKFYEIWNQIALDQKQQVFIEKCTVNLQKLFQIQMQYKYLITINNNSPQFKHLMQLYSRYIIFDQHFYSVILKDIKQIHTFRQKKNSLNENMQRKTNIFNKNSFMAIISHNLQSFGNILWVSKNSKQILKTTRQELLKININQIMPSIFSSYHTQILQNWHKNGTEFRINKMTHLWMIDKQGFASSCNVYAKVVPNNGDYSLMGYIEKMNEKDYIILEEDGEICCGGSMFYQATNLTPKIVKQNLINIQIFCPNFFNYFKPIFNQKSIIQPKLKWFFSIPKNIQSILKNFGFKKQNIFSDFKIQTFKKCYSHLSQQKMYQFKQKYLIFLKNQINRISQEIDHHSFRMECEFSEKKFYTGKIYKKYFILKIINIKWGDSFFNDYLDEQEIHIQKLDQQLNKIKNSIKEIQAKKKLNQKDENYIDSEKIPKTLQVFKDILKGYKRQKSKSKQKIRISSVDKKKILSLTIKLLKEPQIFTFKQRNKPILIRESQNGKNKKKKNIKFSQPINKNRVQKNILKMKKALIRQGIFSIKMIQVFNLNNDAELFLQTRVSKTKTVKFQKQQYTNSEVDSQSGGQSINQNNQMADDIQKMSFKQSVASSVNFISITTAIKSLKQQLKKLRSPKSLKIINILIIIIIMILMILSLSQNIIFRSVISNYYDGLKLLKQTNVLGQKYEIVYNNLESLRQNSRNKMNEQSLIIERRIIKIIRQTLQQITSLLKQNFVKQEQVADQDKLTVNLNKNLNFIVKNSTNYKFQLYQIYDCFKRIQNRFPNVQFLQCHQIISNKYSLFNTSWIRSFQQNLNSKILIQNKIQYYQFLIIILQQSIIITFLLILIPLIYITNKKTQQTLKLFKKINKKDIQKYRLHFYKLKNYFQDGFLPVKILTQLSQHQQSEQMLKSQLNSKTNKKDVNTNISINFTYYFKLLIFFSIIILIYFGKYLPNKIYLEKLYNAQQNFQDLTLKINFIIRNPYQFKLYFNNSTDLSFQQLFLHGHIQISQAITNVFKSKISEQLKEYIVDFVSRNGCKQYKSEQCLQSKLSIGILNSLIDFQTYLYYTGLNIIDNLFNFREIINSNDFIEREMGFYESYKRIEVLEKKLVQSQLQNIQFLKFYKIIYSVSIFATFFIMYSLVWRILYSQISKKGSFINAFLLLLPYDLIKQNPYIKLHIKQEFNFNGTTYL